MKKKPRLDFSHIMFSGSSYKEYEQFFNLDAKALVGQKILDCPSGAASFAVDARKLGLNVLSVDPQFERSLEELRAQGTNDIDQVSERYHEKQEMLYWELFANPKELEAQRRSSLEAFCSDYQKGKARGDYVDASLPNLPFDDNEFSLVLSGHLFFLYADYLDYNFHLDSILELLRVTRNEVSANISNLWRRCLTLPGNG